MTFPLLGAFSGAQTSFGKGGWDSGINTSGQAKTNNTQSAYTQNQSSGISGGLGGILGAKTGLIEGLFNGLTNSFSGNQSSGQSGNILGNLVGGVATGVHHTAENLINAVGLSDVFAPIDDAIIHPLLWDPISTVTGVDVSSHPDGVANVSDPLGVRSSSAYGESQSTSENTSQNNGLFGLLDAKTGLIGSLLNGLTGSLGGSSSGNPIGNLVGGAAQGVHHLAETVIDATGLGPIFSPIDDAIIHPLLWDPISTLTGVDVSSHPDGIANVSDPLGVRTDSAEQAQSTGEGLFGAKAGLIEGLLGNKLGLVGNLFNSLTGSLGGTSSGSGNPIGNLVGGAAQGVHHLAESVIDATGLGAVFSPIDDALIHPLLWDPISQITGVDVSSHPEGIANVSDPLGVRSSSMA